MNPRLLSKQEKKTNINDGLLYAAINDPSMEFTKDGKVFRFTKKNSVLTKTPVKLREFKNNKHVTFSYAGMNLRLHRALYLKFRGKLDATKVVVTLDGNVKNLNIHNLKQITKAEHQRMVKARLAQK